MENTEKNSNYKARVIYFKTTGKYYCEAELELLPNEVVDSNESKLTLMFMITDRLRELSKNKQLPGVGCDWIKDGCYIFAEVADIGWPCLIENKT